MPDLICFKTVKWFQVLNNQRVLFALFNVVAIKPFLHTFISVHVVHPYSCIDASAAWMKLRFILSVRSEFHMTDSLSLAVHVFACRVLTSLSVYETKNAASNVKHVMEAAAHKAAAVWPPTTHQYLERKRIIKRKIMRDEKKRKMLAENWTIIIIITTHKLLWNFDIHTDPLISARRPDLIIINK